MNSEAAVVVSAEVAEVSPVPPLPPLPRTPLYATPPRLAILLRVVLVAPREVPAWLLRFFALVQENAWLELIVLPVGGGSTPRAAGVPADLRALLTYEGGRASAPGFAPVAIDGHDGIAFEAGLHEGMDVAVVRATVTALRPDLILLLGAAAWAEALGDRAKWGCWEFDSCLTDGDRAALALLEPVLRGEVATQVELELRHVDRPPTTLATSWGSTCRASVSVQREQAFRKIPALLMRSLRQLASGDLHVPAQRTARLQLSSTQGPTVFGAGLLTLASTLVFRLAERRRRRAQGTETPWRLVMRHGPEPIDVDGPGILRHSILSAPGNQYWADPSVVEDGGRRLLFVEQWADTDTKGVIACLELLPDAKVQPLGVILDRPFHMSYPQPFRWKGQWYMTVESSQSRCVSLFRADEFPMQWQHVTDLLTGWTCVDPTLHHDGHHWYLFANVAESGGSTWDELFLFVADSPLGPFRPHPANPIVSDARHARPAGHLFLRDGRLIRPAQDCAPCYGAAIVFNEVLELSPTHYRERTLGRLDSRWASGLDGCHTYNEAAGVEVLDARGTPPRDSARITVLESACGREPPDRVDR